MVLCQAFGCSNRSGKSSGKSFHPIPDPAKDPELCGKWLAAIKVEKFKVNSYVFDRNNVICSDHFLSSDYEDDIRARLMSNVKPRKMLKDGVVPSIFAHKQPSKARTSTEERLIKASKRQVSMIIWFFFYYLGPILSSYCHRQLTFVARAVLWRVYIALHSSSRASKGWAEFNSVEKCLRTISLGQTRINIFFRALIQDFR